MNIKKLNFQMMKSCEELSMSVLCFFRPLHGKLFRVVGMPEVGNKTDELNQVLNTLCLRKKDGVWYFKIKDTEDIVDVLSIFDAMGIPNTLVEPDEAWCN